MRQNEFIVTEVGQWLIGDVDRKDVDYKAARELLVMMNMLCFIVVMVTWVYMFVKLILLYKFKY